MATMWLWKFWLVDFQETCSQEPLKGLNWNLVYMFLWMSLTCDVTVCAIWKFKMATSGGQSLHWNPMGNNIFIFFLRTAEQNLTKLGRDVSCEVLKRVLSLLCIGQFVMPIILTWVLFRSKCAELLLDQEKQIVTI